ncbi:MAG: alpha/beta fold hydrolase [Microcoleaceae cyanobacterium]
MKQSSFSLHTQIQGQGFPIVCLHGHPGSGSCMSVFTQHLSQRFQTITPDLRGYGKSQTHQPFTMADHLTDLETLLNQQQIQQCLVLGWSLGGILALELALKCPERVVGLILVATAAYPRGSHPAVTWVDNLYTGIAGLINSLVPGWQWNIDTFGKSSLFRYLIQQHTPQTYSYLAKYAVPAYLQTSTFATQALTVALKQGYNRQSELQQLQQPCLVLAGAGDRHITPQSSAETAQNLSQCEFYCYPDTAHLFPWEIPDQVLADIDRWLAEQFPITNHFGYPLQIQS